MWSVKERAFFICVHKSIFGVTSLHMPLLRWWIYYDGESSNVIRSDCQHSQVISCHPFSVWSVHCFASVSCHHSCSHCLWRIVYASELLIGSYKSTTGALIKTIIEEADACCIFKENLITGPATCEELFHLSLVCCINMAQTTIETQWTETNTLNAYCYCKCCTVHYSVDWQYQVTVKHTVFGEGVRQLWMYKWCTSADSCNRAWLISGYMTDIVVSVYLSANK